MRKLRHYGSESPILAQPGAQEVIQFRIRPFSDAVVRILGDVGGIEFAEGWRDVIQELARKAAVVSCMALIAKHGGNTGAFSYLFRRTFKGDLRNMLLPVNRSRGKLNVCGNGACQNGYRTKNVNDNL